MILYTLVCTGNHYFEAWFAGSAAYDELHRENRIECPVCGEHQVEKAPMAPRIGKGSKERETSSSLPAPSGVPANSASHTYGASEVTRMVSEFCRTVEEKCDYVGPKFPEEARKIHYGETDARGIYGHASPAEAVALKEEGIEVAAIPWVPKPDA